MPQRNIDFRRRIVSRGEPRLLPEAPIEGRTASRPRRRVLPAIVAALFVVLVVVVSSLPPPAPK
jgi:hypothetical protein